MPISGILSRFRSIMARERERERKREGERERGEREREKLLKEVNCHLFAVKHYHDAIRSYRMVFL